MQENKLKTEVLHIYLIALVRLFCGALQQNLLQFQLFYQMFLRAFFIPSYQHLHGFCAVASLTQIRRLFDTVNDYR